MFAELLLCVVLGAAQGSSAAPAATPPATPAATPAPTPPEAPAAGQAPPAAAKDAPPAVEEVPVDLQPPGRPCPTDRRLPRSMRYAVLPLHGDIIDPSVVMALQEVSARHNRTSPTNTLVLDFRITGGDHDDTLALAEAIAKVRAKMPVIGVLGSAVGPGALLPLLCDYLVVLDPGDRAVLDWSPASDVPSANLSAALGTQVQEFQPFMPSAAASAEMIRALMDPELDLYLWRSPDRCFQFGTKAPSGVESVQLCSGTDAVTGLTGAQLVTSGLALAGTGGVDSVGASLGAQKWIAVPGAADKVLAQVKSKLASDRTQVQDALRTGFRAVRDARSIVAAMVEAEAAARASDPRNQQYRRSYARTWNSSSSSGSGSRRWSYSSVSSTAWQKNVDLSIDAWQAVLNMYEQASTAASQARLIAKKLAESGTAKVDLEFAGEVAALQREVDALLQQGPALDAKGANARTMLDWLRANRVNPAM